MKENQYINGSKANKAMYELLATRKMHVSELTKIVPSITGKGYISKRTAWNYVNNPNLIRFGQLICIAGHFGIDLMELCLKINLNVRKLNKIQSKTLKDIIDKVEKEAEG